MSEESEGVAGMSLNTDDIWAEFRAVSQSVSGTMDTSKWAEIRVLLELFVKRFHHEPLPWALQTGLIVHSNTSKAIYMKFLTLSYAGMADIEWCEHSETLLGIKSVKVPCKHRDAFDEVIFPSFRGYKKVLSKDPSKLSPKLYTVTKQWETAGFRQKIDKNGDLLFWFDAAVCTKQKKQQKTKESWKKKQPREPKLSPVSTSSELPREPELSPVGTSFEELLGEIEWPIDSADFYDMPL